MGFGKFRRKRRFVLAAELLEVDLFGAVRRRGGRVGVVGVAVELVRWWGGDTVPALGGFGLGRRREASETTLRSESGEAFTDFFLRLKRRDFPTTGDSYSNKTVGNAKIMPQLCRNCSAIA